MCLIQFFILWVLGLLECKNIKTKLYLVSKDFATSINLLWDLMSKWGQDANILCSVQRSPQMQPQTNAAQNSTSKWCWIEAANILTICHHLSSQWREFTFWQIANWGDTTREIWGGCQSEEVDANILTISSPRGRSYDVCSGMWWHWLVISTSTTSSSTKFCDIAICIKFSVTEHQQVQNWPISRWSSWRQSWLVW